MSALTYASLRPEYARLWAGMSVRSDKLQAIDATARKILSTKGRYEAVEAKSGVPWYVIALIHAMESDLDFSTHLHNGDPLSARTRQVPKGRPETGVPPFIWEVSAADALDYDNFEDVSVWTIERIAYQLEGYNGWGYRRNHATVLSPYLWSCSAHYSRGKYASDGKWDADLVSEQIGAMVLLKRLMALDATIAPPLGSDVPTVVGASPDVTAPTIIPADTKSIQAALLKLGYDLGPMGADGIAGSRTREAIRDFQAAHGLDVDGVAGARTRTALAVALSTPASVAPVMLLPLAAADLLEPPVPEPAPPTEETVKSVQRRLRELGYYEAGEIDGDFGDRTTGAVLAFRAAQGLPLITRIDTELLASLAGARPRTVAPQRAEAPLAEIAAKVPAVAAARVAGVLSGSQAAITGAAAVLIGVADNVTAATDRLSPLKLLLASMGTLPAWVWVGAVAAASFVLWRASVKATQAGAQDYRDARTM